MPSLRGAALVIFGGVFGCTAVGSLVVGCSGDDSGAPQDSGGPESEGGDVTTHPDTGGDTAPDMKNDVKGDATDGGGDVTAADGDATTDSGDSGDVTVNNDAGPDGDAATEADAASSDGDASEISDGDGAATSDGDATEMSDGDAAEMSDGDAGEIMDADAGDAADAKVIPPGLLAYPGQYVTALCAGWANCCGAGFDTTTCQSDWSVGGWDNTLLASSLYDAGNLTFDSTQAAACTAALQAWPCGAWTATANQAIISACSNVLGGTIPIGGTGCGSSFECVSGAYCNSGTCTALVSSGGTCSKDEQCSYIATKQPASYCNLYPSDGGTPATGTCAAPQADGTSSFCGNSNAASDFACTNRLCGDTLTCASTATNPGTNACSVYGGG